MDENIIKSHKGLHRNIYSSFKLFLQEDFVLLISFLLGMSFVSQILEFLLPSSDRLEICGTIISFLIYGFICLYRYKYNKMKIEPYTVTKNFSGLFCVDNLGKLNLTEDNGLLSREIEVKYLYKTINHILEQDNNKQAICLIGKSGCGKSTIIYFLEKYCSSEMKVFDYSKKYDSIVLNLYKDIGRNWENKLREKNEKYLFIFDQFEQFFYKTESKQKEIEETIKKLTIKNVAIIFSIREEFLTQFIKNFDLNNLNTDIDNRAHYHGIIANRDIVSRSVNSLNNENSYFIYCLDEDEEKKADYQYSEYKKLSMEGQCIDAFGSSGTPFYLRFKHCPLIQQQIIFNVLNNEQIKTGFITFEEKDENFYLKRFYDIQLCSTGNFFIASRIMYLLCLGNFYHISFETDDIMRALCIPDIEDKKKEFEHVINHLQDIQLIKWTRYNSKQVNEIAHDYVAKSYEAYANTEMPVDVKAALDEYVTEFIKGTSINQKINEFRKKSGKPNRVKWILFLSVFFCLGIFAYRYFGDENISFFIVILSIISLIYVYTFYFYITRFCPNKRTNILVVVCFIFSMISGSVTTLLHVWWLVCLGVGNFFIGVSCLIIGCEKRISNIGRKMFFSYGVKTMLMGILLVFLDVFSRNIAKADLIEIVAMGSLLVYAYYSHINEEFIYSHLEGMFSCEGEQ